MFIIYLFIYLFNYLFFWESRGGVDKEGERESQEGSTLLVWSPMRGTIPQKMKSWPELNLRVRCSTDWPTQAPPFLVLSIWSINLLPIFFLFLVHFYFWIFYQKMRTSQNYLFFRWPNALLLKILSSVSQGKSSWSVFKGIF